MLGVCREVLTVCFLLNLMGPLALRSDKPMAALGFSQYVKRKSHVACLTDAQSGEKTLI
jgi:hypothetical protein